MTELTVEWLPVDHCNAVKRQKKANGKAVSNKGQVQECVRVQISDILCCLLEPITLYAREIPEYKCLEKMPSAVLHKEVCINSIQSGDDVVRKSVSTLYFCLYNSVSSSVDR